MKMQQNNFPPVFQDLGVRRKLMIIVKENITKLDSKSALTR